jgi:hypothetical protein
MNWSNAVEDAPINPKAIAGRQKPQMHAVPPAVLLQIGAAMAEGERKYGLMNWRDTPICISDYIDSTHRHLAAWAGGEDIDPDSGLPHFIKIITGLVVVADAAAHGTLIDDRWKQKDAT